MTSIDMSHRRVREAGSFSLALPPEQAFWLFTAEGERRWAAGWEPAILGGPGQQPGLVFLTGAGEEATIWTVIESDPGAMRHFYSRVTPGSRAGTVDVRLRAEGAGTRVDVCYDLTALSPAGARALDQYAGAGFAHMMHAWREAIEAALAPA